MLPAKLTPEQVREYLLTLKAQDPGEFKSLTASLRITKAKVSRETVTKAREAVLKLLEKPEFKGVTIGMLNRGTKPPPIYVNPKNAKETWQHDPLLGPKHPANKKPAWAVPANRRK